MKDTRDLNIMKNMKKHQNNDITIVICEQWHFNNNDIWII